MAADPVVSDHLEAQVPRAYVFTEEWLHEVREAAGVVFYVPQGLGN